MPSSGAPELPDTSDSGASAIQGQGTPETFVVPCRQLTYTAPLRWLKLGWHDLRRTPAITAVFGLLVFLLSVGVSVLAWWLGRFALLATLLSGFIFIAPLLGVGMYGVSKQLAAGESVRLRACWALMQRVLGQAAVFALAQLIVLLVWSRAGMMVNAFVPFRPDHTMELIEFLALGSLVGSFFAAVTFALSAFSLPMIADRDVDMVTACVSSVHAVLRNKGVMVLWAAFIAVLTGVGLATALLGLMLTMPWLAYASWHAYRETLDATAWPAIEPSGSGSST